VTPSVRVAVHAGGGDAAPVQNVRAWSPAQLDPTSPRSTVKHASAAQHSSLIPEYPKSATHSCDAFVGAAEPLHS
jgi:hypothetical protein